MRYLKFISLLCFLLYSAISIAQQQTADDIMDKSLEELMKIEVFVTSRTQSQESNSAPATVRVVTSEQIELRGYQSLLDLFYDMPEVKVDFGVDPRWMNDITLRGIRGMDKFIILLDGVRISSPTNDVVSIMENYPLNFTEQVEVVFGPASALYGADAFSGVINIISKKTENDEIVEVGLSGGGYNTLTANSFLQKKFNDKICLSFGGQYFYDEQPDLSKFYKEEFEGMEEELQTGTFNTVIGPITPKTPVFSTVNQKLKAYGVYANLSIDKLNFAYFGNYARNPSTVANSPHNSVYNEYSMFGHYINMGVASYNTEVKDIQSISSITFSRYDLDKKSNFRNVWTNMEPAYLFAYSHMLKGEQLFSYELNDKLKLSLGGTYEIFTSMPRSNDLQEPGYGSFPEGVIVNSKDSLNPMGISADLVKVEYNNYGGFAEIDISPFENVILTVGGRFDNDDRFGTTINPRAGIVANLFNKKITMKGLFGSAFLAPSPQYIYDRYGNFYSNDGGLTYESVFFQMPNPNLEPQKVNTAELSLSSIITSKFSASITTYFSKLTGLISPITDSVKILNLYPDMTYQGYKIHKMQINDNLGESEIYGGTFQVNYFNNFSSNFKINAYAAYSYIDGNTDIDENGPIQKRNLPGVSQNTVKTGVDMVYKKISFSPRIIFMDKQRTFNAQSVKYNNEKEYQEIEGFTLVNLNFGYRFSNYAKIFINAENMTDIRYRNVNIGAFPENIAGGSAAAEFSKGAPQNPLRLTAGVNIRF